MDACARALLFECTRSRGLLVVAVQVLLLTFRARVAAAAARGAVAGAGALPRDPRLGSSVVPVAAVIVEALAYGR
eukprot:COSAG03_NODE_3311_length_2090_cov_24.871631_4_plen_75_part_00